MRTLSLFVAAFAFSVSRAEHRGQNAKRETERHSEDRLATEAATERARTYV